MLVRETQVATIMKEKFSMHKFYTEVRKNNISLTFRGIMSQDVLSLIGMSLKRRPDNEVIAKRLFGIVVELAQNIYHYSASKQYSEKDKKEIGVGIVTIGEDQNYYIVNSGNLVRTENIAPITERCKYINGLDERELKLFKKQQLKLPQRPDKPGANIGLIELKRRSGNPLLYDTIAVDHDYTFLSLSVKIKKQQKDV